MNAEKQCLVIMPFGNSKDEQLFYDMVYSHIILPAFQEANISASRIDREVVGEEPLTSAIEKRLRTAPLVIADLSDNNPNVLYELGFRRAQGKPFIGISRKPGDSAFWPKSFLLIDYTASNAVDKIARSIRQKYAEVQVRLEAEDELTELTEKVRTKGTFNNPFQDRLAAWRIRRAREQVGMIQKSEAEFEAKTSTAYVAHLFQGMMGMLEDGDEYWTVTNMDFWSDKEVGDSPFLDANVRAARKGAKISRAFIIDKNQLNNSSVRNDIEFVLQKHKDACDRVNADKPGNMVVKCLLSENFNKDRTRYGHFGLARPLNSKDIGNWGSVVIAPRYDSSLPGVVISHLKFVFWIDPTSDLEIMKYVHMFEGAFGAEASEDLDIFLKRIHKPRNRVKGA
jgi:hypothetical protein